VEDGLAEVFEPHPLQARLSLFNQQQDHCTSSRNPATMLLVRVVVFR
jgi:hypothetical protein